MNKLKAIKILVAIMTFLLILGVTAVAILLHKRIKQDKQVLKTSVSLNLQQPYGTHIEQMLSKNDHLHILVKAGGRPDRILVLSPDNQQILQEITLN